MLRMYKLLGLGVALVVLAMAAGNSEQVGVAQPSTERGPQLVWIAPQGGPRIRPDYPQLFATGSPWASVKAGIQVFKFYLVTFAQKRLSNVPLAVQALKEAHIAIAVEAYGINEGDCSGANFGDLPQILDQVLAVLKQGGQTLDFFHADSPYDYDEGIPGGQGWAKLKALQDFVHSRGLRFGLIYNSERGGETSDELFFQETLAAKSKFAQAGGDPDDLIVQSWYTYPSAVLPEDQPCTFTYLVREFLKRSVPVLGPVVSSPAADGSRQVTGTLKDQSGYPIANAPIELSLKPLAGSGVYADYTTSGTVPSGATQAVVGFRVNTECDCSGASDFTLYEVRYVEGQETTNRVPNANFSHGLQDWAFWGAGTARLEIDANFRQGLHVTATPNQTADLNSTAFPVTAGATYTATFGARVAAALIGSGYFTVIFLKPSGEGTRVAILLEPARVSVGKATTDANGAFQFALRNLAEGKLFLEASYPGDDGRYLPGWASVTVGNSK